MIYVASDLHGYPLNKFLKLLEAADFTDEDTLYVLGDVIDRGRDGVAILRWMMGRRNVRLLLGNHEDMLLQNAYLFESASDSDPHLDPQRARRLDIWMYNGAEPTYEAMQKLLWVAPETVAAMLEYLRKAPLYATVNAGGRKFVLVHGGLGNFHPKKPLRSYRREDLLWTRPTLQTKYYDDATVIFGHTPTMYFGRAYRGRAVKTASWVCIDAGAAGGETPMLLRLDDMKEFYG